MMIYMTERFYTSLMDVDLDSRSQECALIVQEFSVDMDGIFSSFGTC